jgi:hypothetical protein
MICFILFFTSKTVSVSEKLINNLGTWAIFELFFYFGLLIAAIAVIHCSHIIAQRFGGTAKFKIDYRPLLLFLQPICPYILVL